MASTTVTRTVFATTKPGVYIVPSESLPDMFNVVEVSADGSMICSCKGARYRSTCCHRDLVAIETAPFTRPAVDGGPADPFEGLTAA